MTLRSEVEQVRQGPWPLVGIAAVLGFSIAVGVGVKEVFDSRTAGAVASILVFGTFALGSVVKALRERPESLSPLLLWVGAGFLASAVIAVAGGAMLLAPFFALLGAVMVRYGLGRG